MTSLAEALTGPGGIERSFHCPVHGDNRPSASVNVISGLWICYTCGAKGKAGDGYSVNPDQLLSYLKGMKQRYEQHYFPESWLELYTAGGPHPYWLSRFSPEAIEHFKLGFDEERECATYPLYDQAGLLLGVVMRHVAPDWDGPKYVYPRFLDVTKLLFNYTQLVGQRRVLLVEGAADAIAAWEAGYTGYAIYGSRMTEHQIQLLRRVNAMEVWTAFDHDEAGEKCHNRVVEMIKDLPVHRVQWDGAKDLAEMQVTVRREVLSQLGKPDQERVVSTTCESGRTDQPKSGREPSESTSGPARLRIKRTRP
jgi:hypothetical protein